MDSSTNHESNLYKQLILLLGLTIIFAAFAFAFWHTDATTVVAQDSTPPQAISLQILPPADAKMRLVARQQALIPQKNLDTAWDRYLNGELDQMTDEQKKGALLFFGDANCVACHSGNDFTNGSYHNLGVPQRDEEQFVNLGRFRETGYHGDMMAFETTTLRNVADTAPYMHNDVLPTLESTIRQHMTSEALTTQPYIENASWMVREPAVKESLTDTEVQYLVDFLYALSSE